MATTTHHYIIIGAGFAGICAGIKLKEAGFNNFVILERNPHLGGTWYDNAYPGAACDVQSHLYSYSFEPKPDWSRMFGPQEEILHYMEHCAGKYGINAHFKFNTTVNGAVFDDASAVWQITDTNGNTYTAPVVISCSGGLSQPALPNIKGINTFKGEMFHTAKWDKAYDLINKTVAVIGTGASAIQVVPTIAPSVKQLFLFQRTPPWIMPKPDRQMSNFEKKMFAALPFMQRLYRGWLYWVHEILAVGFVSKTWILKMGQRMALRHLKKTVANEELRLKLTPNYTMGCKRVLISNDYYPAVQRSNVALVIDHITQINETGVVTNNGKQYDVDAIILATGFHAADESMLPFDIKGKNGISLKETWRNGAEAYLGSTIAGFPNLFLVIGPNTGLGHSSMILMIEAQVQYILEALKTMQQNKWGTINLKPQAQKTFNDDLQQKLTKTVWQSGGCVSWYQAPNGKNVTLWPGYTFTFMKRTKKFEPDKYEVA